jgi:hypothetical protein
MNLLEQFGRPYARVAQALEPVGRGKCFTFCSARALANARLTYVEGQARDPQGHLQPHAWLLDARGVVLDPTWGNQGQEYFGIAFRTEYLRRLRREGVTAEVGYLFYLQGHFAHEIPEALVEFESSCDYGATTRK